MEFIKMQGLGNDFIMVDCLNGLPPFKDFHEASRKLCDRHFGIGADGLVLILPSETADIRMRIFNPDGSEPEMCGNAIRCLARYVYEYDIVRKRTIRVETLAGLIVPEVITEGEQVVSVRVDMGEPRLERNLIPMDGPPGKAVNEPIIFEGNTYKITGLSMGNPHCVIFVPDVNEIPLTEIGPKLEVHEVFPRKTNVEFVQVLNDSEVNMRVWERGAGETLACGTGACATGVACILNNLTGRKITVHLAGGDLLIEWGTNNHVYMTGPAQYVFRGEIQLSGEWRVESGEWD
ncbi:MAG: diaminopimelate epimerase [Firmicutes bacterium HGW-Firmicutes-8]|nr:MAG: diaminopimelate epimerase [Firmicutes bacterium HGW-Firmicutes-8]